MRVLISFIHKEVLHILRDARTLVVIFGIPLVQLLIFGYAIRMEINNIDVGIMDLSADKNASEIVNQMESGGFFNVAGYYTNYGEIDEAFKKGEIKQAIIFEPNFGDNLYRFGLSKVQILNDASNPNTATLTNSYMQSILFDYAMSLSPQYPKSLPATVKSRMLYNPELKSVYMFVPGLIATLLMLISALMTSITITREKEFGNMEILLVSPLKPYIIIIGKVIPYVVLAFANGLIILAMAHFVFGVPIRGSLGLLLGEMSLFILTSLALGILISTIAKNQVVAMIISLVGLLMPTMLLSGFIYPIENMPLWLQYICNALPATWFLVIIKGILLKGVGIEVLFKETLILASMAFLFTLISIKKLKMRLD